MLNTTNITILIFYILILVVISIIANRYSKTHENFLLGGRSLNSFTAAISAGAADMSGWLLLGLPGAIYAIGLGQSWMAIGLAIGAFCNWTFIAKKLREKSTELQAITLPDFFSKVVEEKGKAIRVIASIMILIFFTMYVASGFVSGAKVFSQYFSMNYHYGLILTYVIIAVCTIIGGFLAISWGEIFQGLIMVFVIVLVPTLAIINLNDLDGTIVSRAMQTNPHIFDMTYNMSFIAILSLLAWGFGYLGQPHILAKFMALKNPDLASKARNIGITWMVIGLVFSIGIGILGAAIFVKSKVSDPELIMVLLSEALLHPVFIGLIIIGILSAVFSTANAQLLIVSSVFTNDLKVLKSTVTMNRIIIAVVGLIALYLGWDSNSNILSMVGYAWAGFGACFGPLMLLSLRSKKKINSFAALMGVIAGGLCVIVWNILRKYFPEVELFQLYELLPAFVLSIVTIMILNTLGSKEVNKKVANH